MYMYIVHRKVGIRKKVILSVKNFPQVNRVDSDQSACKGAG